ncbi:hypothetical protein SteCoe_31590 [Stentor coeruleus]|uniref:HTH myb-type domain-containing protein n=1 Tax=Stentor coeruleus TaxID=5963 RepID=A0A1R2B1E3_9CILI|nr:hypothetical protein SteCoe_31590 [Stentor coeruleus]
MVKRNSRKIKLWALEEDLALRDIAEKFNSKNWKIIAKNVSEKIGTIRTFKQCRDRWLNYLNKGINKSSFTDYEIDILISIQEVYQNRWIDMAKKLKGRTGNQIKNFFHAMIRRNIRKFNKGKNNDEKLEFISMKMLNNSEIRKILLAKKNVPRAIISKTKLSNDAIYYMQSLKDQKIQTETGKNAVYAADFSCNLELPTEDEIMTKCSFENIFNMYQYCTEYLLPTCSIQNLFLS